MPTREAGVPIRGGRASLDPAELGDLRDLVDRVGRFYVRDKKMEKAHAQINHAIAVGIVTLRDRESYLRTVRGYFTAFEREARVHLGEVEARLKHASQVQFNLAAERGVATSRVEAVRTILGRIPTGGHE